MPQQVQINKQDDGTYKVSVTKVVPQVEEQVFGTLDEAANFVKQVEQAEAQPQG